MKRKFLLRFFSILLIISSLFTVIACNRNAETVSCFPKTQINTTLNLNLGTNYNLNYVGGWIYVNDLSQQAGTRGLIVVCTSSDAYGNKKFNAYDRNAPHICPDANTTLNVVQDIKVVCPKDNAEWILINGQQASVSNLPLKSYYTNYNPTSNILTIYN